MLKDKFMIRIQKQNENIKKYSNTSSLNSNTSSLISTVRLITFLAIIFITYVTIKIDYKTIYVVIDFILPILFICLIIYHNIIKDKLNFSKEIIDINNKYLARIDAR